MRIVQHIGAHVTDGERLIRALAKDAEGLAERGIAVPAPGSYRGDIHGALVALLNGEAPAREALLAEIPGTVGAERLVLSNPAFICTPTKVFEGAQFYGKAGMKVRALSDLLAPHPVEIFLATRNPATFLPAVFEQARLDTLADWLDGVDPETISWSDLVTRIRAAAPEVPVTVWANEDTPLIWGRILRAMAGVGFDTPLAGAYDLPREIMTEAGGKRLTAYLATHPPATEAQAGRIVAAFLDKYAREGEVVEEVDMPGWDAARVARMTEAYEADLARLSGIEGVTVLAP